MERPEIPPEPKRRDFIKKSCAVIIGAVTGLVPAISGLMVFLDPLRRKARGQRRRPDCLPQFAA